jgi:hypothetical protein
LALTFSLSLLRLGLRHGFQQLGADGIAATVLRVFPATACFRRRVQLPVGGAGGDIQIKIAGTCAVRPGCRPETSVADLANRSCRDNALGTFGIGHEFRGFSAKLVASNFRFVSVRSECVAGREQVEYRLGRRVRV